MHGTTHTRTHAPRYRPPERLGTPPEPFTYEPRRAQSTVLHRVVRDHLLSFLERTSQERDAPLPRFVERELRSFVGCGVLAKGFARLRCDDCAHERLVPFSCKGRGFCPSCGGRRMVERTAHLVDRVLPHVPIRQWVLSLPHRLRFLFAFDHKLSLRALRIYARALQSFQRHRARRAGIANAQSGAVTVIQRFASGLRLNLHFHTLLPDGIFHLDDRGALVFTELPPPTDDDIAKLVLTIRERILRMLRRRGILDDDNVPAHDTAADLAETDPALTALMGAAITNKRAFLGDDPGVQHIGRDPRARWVDSRTPLQAHAEGFDLHAAIAIASHDREGLERICRYLLRPAVAQDRISLTDDDNVLLELKREWNDGTSHLRFTPLELLARLASFIPRPRTNLLIYHGVLAPNAKLRSRVVRYGRPRQHEPTTVPSPTTVTSAAQIADRNPRPNPCNRWPDLMRRAFGIDVLQCPRCDGRMRLLATIEAPSLVRKILDHLGIPSQPPKLAPARAPPVHHSTEWP